MDDYKRRLIHLLHYPQITWNGIYKMLKKNPKLDGIYHLKPEEISTFTTPQKNTFLYAPENFSHETIAEQIRQYDSNHISVITIFDREYPAILKEIYQPPWALFTRGDLSLLEVEPKLAVVGSRQPTSYGRNAINAIFPELMAKGVLIVSGLAKGIDALAHERAMKYEGKTIAVIAGGFYHIYPPENMNLAMQLMKTQLVVSEYPPDTKPLRWHFPLRNRIISGLSKGTFIIEAKRKSGSLITANFAVNEGRDVFALPGGIFNTSSEGTNDLIRQGAKLTSSAADIIEEICPGEVCKR